MGRRGEKEERKEKNIISVDGCNTVLFHGIFMITIAEKHGNCIESVSQLFYTNGAVFPYNDKKNRISDKHGFPLNLV